MILTKPYSKMHMLKFLQMLGGHWNIFASRETLYVTGKLTTDHFSLELLGEKSKLLLEFATF